jgi:magnesium-transporting ATPase (P-type)
MILSLGFGALIPLAVWTIVFASFGLHVDPSAGGMILLSSYVIVIVEIMTLVLWHFGRHSSASMEQAASAIFFLGVAFAALWSGFGAFFLWAQLGQASRISAGVAVIALSPIPCVIVYFMNACAARALARECGTNPPWRGQTVRPPANLLE